MDGTARGRAGRVFGDLKVRDGELRLDCNAQRRLRLIKQAVEAHAGKYLRHLEDTVETPQEAHRRREREGPVEEDEAAHSEIDPAVGREIIQEFLGKHYSTWPDHALPALRGKTPRQAMKSAAGRKEVDGLLRLIENGEERKRKNGDPFYDVSRLRRELGFE